jgi:hypothetical protein
MPWYKVTLSHEDIAVRRGITLQESFADLFVAYGAPKGAAMFSNPTIGIHEYYFSPAAAELAEVLIAGYSGVPCDAPTRKEVHILVSHAGAEDIPFAPER